MSNIIYYTLNNNISNSKYGEISSYTYEEKKSKFNCYIFNIDSLEEAKNYINIIKKDNKLARHVVYIYSIKENNNMNIKFSDDGEPQGTGTRAIYETLQKENLTNICVIIVRYFGGILLGAGPLSRAYLNAFKEAMNVCRKEVIYNYINYSFITTYSNFDNINNLLQEYMNNNDIINITNKFNDNIEVSMDIKDTLFNEITSKLKIYILN